MSCKDYIVFTNDCASTDCMNADFFFFSSDGISAEGLITDTNMEEAEITRAMIAQAQSSYLLYDTSKLNKKFLYSVCNVDEIAGAISEAN